MSTVNQTGEELAPAGVRRPGAPGAESAGPPLTELVHTLSVTNRALESLAAYARLDQRERMQDFTATAQSDGNGDALLELFQVPSGAQGFLTWCAVDMAGVTPASPVTSATLWLGLYAAASAGITNPAQVVAVGSLLDMSPDSVAADAQIPFTFRYGCHHTCPLLRGPATFYLVVDATTAARQLAARGSVYVEQSQH